MASVPSSALNLFDNSKYEFDESNHVYYYQGKKVNYSVTQFIEKYFNKFDSESASESYAAKHGLTKEAVLNEWNEKGLISSYAGTIVHAHLENLKRGKRIPYTLPSGCDANAKVLQGVQERLNILLPKADKFHNETRGKLIPVALEYTVGLDTFIAGNIDMLAWNEYAQEFQIWDYKNVKEMGKSGFRGQKCLMPFQAFQDCNYIHYSIQQSMYKVLLKKCYGLDVGSMYLVEFNYTDCTDNFEIHKCYDFSDYCVDELDKLLQEQQR